MIATERLLLRKPRLQDAHDLLEYVGDPEVTRWIGGGNGDLDATRAKIAEWLARWERDGVGHFSVVRDGRVLGRVGFLTWDPATWTIDGPEMELGWTLAQEHWGHGYATEAARAARAWVYSERDVDRVISLIAPDNERSIRVAEKLDATREERVETPHGPADVWVHPR